MSADAPSRKRASVMLLLCAAGLLVVVALEIITILPHDLRPLAKPERDVEDHRLRLGRMTPANTNLVFLGITQTSYRDVPLEDDPDAQRSPALQAMRENFPWSRIVWAELIERLAGAGAKVIALDVTFATPTPNDDALKAALQRHRDRVVVGASLTYQQAQGPDGARGEGFTLLAPSADLLSLPEGAKSLFDPRVGLINFTPTRDGDLDGVIRRTRFRIAAETLHEYERAGEFAESFAARILRQAGRGEAVPATARPVRFRYTSPPERFFKPIPVNEVFYGDFWTNNFAAGKFFRGKIVVIGPAASVMHDAHPTPFVSTDDLMLGPEIHLNVINAALHGEFLHDLGLGWRLALDAVVGLLAALLAVFIPQPVRRLLLFALAGVAYHFLAQLVFDRAGVVLTTVAPLLVIGLCALSTFSYDFVSERVARLKLRTTMGFYFSPKVLEAVLADPGSMQPREAQVTLLLTDLRNSTPLAEKLGPQGMFQLLNQVFEAETAAVMGEEGNLEHFLGDQFLSYWGAPQPQPDGPDRAFRAALKLIGAMERLRETLEPEVKKLFGYGVALHGGAVLVGNKGSAQRLDYGLVGDTVNEAARVEALTKFYGTRFLITRETFRQLTSPPPARVVDRVIVKGKSEPVELLEPQNPCAAANFTELARAYAAAFTPYEAGRFAEAQAAFRPLAEQGDRPSQLLAERCATLAAEPPAAWRGVWAMENK